MKLTLLFLLLAQSMNLLAQNYNLTNSNQAYADLSNPQSINNNTKWSKNNPSFQGVLPFNFKVRNSTFTDYTVVSSKIQFTNAQGDYSLLTSCSQSFTDRGCIFTPGIICGGQDPSASPISVQIDGTVGNRIAKFQWKNAGLYFELSEDGTTDDFMNSQIWLYESDGHVDFRYGNSIVQSVNSFGSIYSGPIIHFAYNSGNNRTDSFNMFVIGDPINPVEGDLFGPNKALDGTPPTGSVYTFTPESPQSISSKNDSKTELTVYPSPARNEIYIDAKAKYIDLIEIFNLWGQKVLVSKENSRIDVQNLASGIYTIRAFTDDGPLVAQFVKE